ncbi:MAG: hypothetical protein IT160_14280 [Bryobacterales bacterium]|nr:hypothetical protein [Bryobacterales bacterium]
MAFRTEKRVGTLLSGLLLAPAFLLGQQTFRYQVWHGHSRLYSLPPHVHKAGDAGTLTIDDAGVSFRQTSKKAKRARHPEVLHWGYQDIQQLKIAPKSLTVLTYQDDKWKLGADRQYDFDLVAGPTFEDAYRVLKLRLDQRFVAVIADAAPRALLWEIPVKHRIRFGGDQGVLQVGAGEIVYRSARSKESRTWRYEDIDNISTSGPFQLTITTFERAKLDYGSRKEFNFELKERLGESRYNDLWLRLNRAQGLNVLGSYREQVGAR